MAHFVATMAFIFGGLAVCGIGYYALCLWSARSFLRDISRQSAQAPDFVPPVSILKPLRGTDPHMYEAFRSHCLQDYPDYELIFGVAERSDPAVALVERLQREFPERHIRLLICPLALGTNLKVSSLVQMAPSARHEYLLVNDGDIRVPNDYLRQVMSPFADPHVGMVTSLYRGTAGKNLASRLESLGISTDFIAGVLAARELEGIHFALGSTLAFSRNALQEIGGFEPLLDYLADDFELGSRIAATGREVVLSPAVVETHVPNYSLREYWTHQLRWARGMRNSRKWGYLGVCLTFGLPWALLATVLSRGAMWAWFLLGVTAIARLAQAILVGNRILHDPKVLADSWLLPLRDALGLVIWISSYMGHTVAWRGDQFVLKNGKLKSLQPARPR